MGMKYLAVLSKEHEELPFAEVRAILEGEGINFNLERQGNLAIIEMDRESKLFTRAAMLREGGRVLQIVDDPEEINIDLGERTFSVRYRNFTGRDKDAREVESITGSRIRGKVNLKNPDLEILLIDTGRYYLVLNERVDPGFYSRINEKRPFRTNLALQPKMARLLVNLGRVKEGDRILDPFCGGGSILIEASLMGIRADGIDIGKKMYHGARLNLSYFGIDSKVYLGDVSLALSLGRYDAIITDPPYGRGSSTNRESIEKLYKRSFEIFRRVLNDGHVSIILPEEKYVDLALENFTLKEKYSLRVHRSLVRHITVLA
ncbi:MAG: methyltransferase [Thermoplasmatales archaeon]|jgi:tRNA (guanine10-N2)-dimethyltransferase|nr:methyltransferase [Thermoplasmatales archaeon]